MFLNLSKGAPAFPYGSCCSFVQIDAELSDTYSASKHFRFVFTLICFVRGIFHLGYLYVFTYTDVLNTNQSIKQSILVFNITSISDNVLVFYQLHDGSRNCIPFRSYRIYVGFMHVAQSLVFCIYFYFIIIIGFLFVLFLSVRRFTTSEFSFGKFIVFVKNGDTQRIKTFSNKLRRIKRYYRHKVNKKENDFKFVNHEQPLKIVGLLSQIGTGNPRYR